MKKFFEEISEKRKVNTVTLLMIGYDAVAIIMSYFLALLIRFDFHYSEIPGEFFSTYISSIFIYAIACIIVLALFGLYGSIWIYASVFELERLLEANVLTLVIHVLAMRAFSMRIPISYYVFGIVIQFTLLAAIRFSYRFINMLRGVREERGSHNIPILIIGAGSAGRTILRETRVDRRVHEIAVGFVDDDKNKVGRSIDGVKVLGTRDDILSIVQKYEVKKIYIAISEIDNTDKRDILNICKETDCDLKIIPKMYLATEGSVLQQMQNVRVEDLLGRDAIKVNSDQIFDELRNKVILITGAGGSIGSELARQIASHKPKQLILFDIYENSLYDIQLELKKKYNNLDLVTLVGSVRDSRRIFQVFETYHPNYVYHAAAHKHVPLMEDSPCEAIKNNVIGTYKTALAAMINGCDRFLLISTDKAVNPTNIMGASKRLCEMVVQSFDRNVKLGMADKIPQLFTHELKKTNNIEASKEQIRNAKTEFVAVRFGNVLGSNGSVIPIFRRQLEEGGPLTVTHPDIVRYFMTIPEAVGLVLQASVYANGGEIFVLDMGEPVKIVDLARNMIKLAGKEPDIDIAIKFTGLRPGEKLYEEKLMDEEGLQKTENELIFVGSPIVFDSDEFYVQLEQLMDMAYKNKEEIVDAVAQCVKTYKPAKNMR